MPKSGQVLARFDPLNHTDALGEDVRVRLRLGRFAEAQSLLSGRSDPPALIELARIAFNTEGDPKKALELLTRAWSNNPTREQKLLIRALRGVAEASMGSAATTLDITEFSDITPSCVGQAIYWISLAAYMRNDFESARRWLGFHVPDAPSMCSQFLVLRGLIVAAEHEDFEEQATLTDAALAILQQHAPDELYLIATIAQTMAWLIREVPSIDAVERLMRLNDSCDWADGIATSRFHVLRSLGWARAVRGEYHDGLRLISRAMSYATNDISRVYGHLDYASIAVFWNQRRIANVAFEVAHDIAQNIAWDHAGRDNIAALPLAAEVAAELGRYDLALHYVNMTEATKGSIERHYSLARGERLQALGLTRFRGHPDRSLPVEGQKDVSCQGNAPNIRRSTNKRLCAASLTGGNRSHPLPPIWA